MGGAAAVGWLYPIRRGRGLDWVGAVTLGHAILHRPGLLDGPALAQRLTLAHELAHTRQHDRLGPLYLPMHILAQAMSALLSLGGRPVVSRVHDRNPLEQTFICISAGATHDPSPFRDAREIEDFLGRVRRVTSRSSRRASKHETLRRERDPRRGVRVAPWSPWSLNVEPVLLVTVVRLIR